MQWFVTVKHDLTLDSDQTPSCNVELIKGLSIVCYSEQLGERLLVAIIHADLEHILIDVIIPEWTSQNELQSFSVPIDNPIPFLQLEFFHYLE